jgi:hypothetical protein
MLTNVFNGEGKGQHVSISEVLSSATPPKEAHSYFEREYYHGSSDGLSPLSPLRALTCGFRTSSPTLTKRWKRLRS